MTFEDEDLANELRRVAERARNAGRPEVAFVLSVLTLALQYDGIDTLGSSLTIDLARLCERFEQDSIDPITLSLGTPDALARLLEGLGYGPDETADFLENVARTRPKPS